MFIPGDCKIISAVPLTTIKEYLRELGAKESSSLVYDYCGLEIEITIGINYALRNLNMPQHTIQVRGDRVSAERFINGFRFRFLSAGG